MLCTVSLDCRLGFMETEIKMDVESIMESLRGYQTASCQATYGIPWWENCNISRDWLMSGPKRWVGAKNVDLRQLIFWQFGSSFSGSAKFSSKKANSYPIGSKNLFGLGQKIPWSELGRPLFTASQKYAWVRSGHSPYLHFLLFLIGGSTFQKISAVFLQTWLITRITY